MRFLAALSFLTSIPLPRRFSVKTGEAGRSTAYFSLVGAIIGLLLAGLNWISSLFLPPALVNGLLIAFLVLITGALHLDGLADTCDGIAGHKTTEDRWQVMHDSRSGAFGIIGIFLLLLIKYVSLNCVPPTLLMATLVLMPVVSRWVMVYAIFAYPYARPEGLGKVFKQRANWQSFVIATILTLAVITGLSCLANDRYFYLTALAITFITWVIALPIAAYLKRKFAGLTGDTYGAINEVAEVCVLIIVCLLAHNQWLWLA
ncbi:adenosylcobinamide-GDP ribazoletransferase [Chloroflexota bacterium]